MNESLNKEFENIMLDNDKYRDIIKLMNRYTKLIIEELTPNLVINLTEYLDKSRNYLFEENSKLKNEIEQYKNIFNYINSSFLGYLLMRKLRKKYPEFFNNKKEVKNG